MCRKCFARLYAVGWNPRLDRIFAGVSRGLTCCPLDMRYMQCAPKHIPSATRGEVSSYLQTLYDNVAETLPDSASESNASSGDELGAWDCNDADALHQKPVKKEVRKLPHGSMYEQWRQYKELGNPGGYKLFWKTWTEDFAHLRFRGKRSHAVCNVCLKHKLMIRALGADAQGRLKQRHLYDMHLRGQYEDRQQYWRARSIARSLQEKVACMVLDAMDQSKFAWPRSFRIGAKEFESFTRPRSHIYGGLCHGHYSLLTISHADTCKGSSMTVEILAHMLTLLSKTVDIRDWTINVLLDNAAGSNKNNCVFSFFGALIYFGLVGHVNVLFLRVGHTHEDRRDFLANLLLYKV